MRFPPPADDNETMIAHGRTSHSYAQRRKCKICAKNWVEFNKAVQEAGGLDKLLQKMEDEQYMGS